MNTVYTGGTFDLFHAGHVRLLERCRQLSLGGKVVVSLNTDAFVERYKGVRPVMDLEERSVVVASCRHVDLVVVNFGCEDSRPAIERIDPDLIAVGDSWSMNGYFRQTGISLDWLSQRGIGLVFLPYTQGISTTEIRRRMSK